ncbi:hypothetical protein JKP88DRAFT_262012 [Tribonema minus]|uniref:MYND-type domain-containing protein n=1 Tax=Tribonema minus TaxID=303371 RepID=A0A836CKI7_9STRA|nr:hypothetical protein JKP88DRAFT_262012 [Tribonema minus]
MAGNMYNDEKGFCYCMQHRRELCHDCAVDHRSTNAVMRGEDYDEVMARLDRAGEAEMQAMYEEHRARSDTGPLIWGGAGTQSLYDAVAAAPPRGRCSHCAKEGSTKKCGKCKSAWYCSRKCQVASWKTHKATCRRLSTGAATADGSTGGGGGGGDGSSGGAASGGGGGGSSSSARPHVISWKTLEALGGACTADNQVLELRVMTAPLTLRSVVSAKDRAGDVRTVAFYCAAPAGLRAGAVLR